MQLVWPLQLDPVPASFDRLDAHLFGPLQGVLAVHVCPRHIVAIRSHQERGHVAEHGLLSETFLVRKIDTPQSCLVPIQGSSIAL